MTIDEQHEPTSQLPSTSVAATRTAPGQDGRRHRIGRIRKRQESNCSFAVGKERNEIIGQRERTLRTKKSFSKSPQWPDSY